MVRPLITGLLFLKHQLYAGLSPLLGLRPAGAVDVVFWTPSIGNQGHVARAW